MKKFKNSWPGTLEDEYYKLVAEQLIELVNSYSWSSYRAKATSTPFKAEELKSLAWQVKNGEIAKSTISHAVEEYIDALQRDCAVKEICLQKGIDLASISPKSDASVDRIIMLTTTMIEVVSPDYIKFCISAVVEGCTVNKSKKRVREFLKLLVPALINSGVPRQWLYENTSQTFYKDEVSSLTPEKMKGFFNLFTEDTGKYCFLFKTNKEFGEYLKGLQEEIEVFTKPEDVPEGFASQIDRLPNVSGRKDVFVWMPYRKDRNPYSAARAFNQWISLFRSLLYLADVGRKGFTPKSALCLKEGEDHASLLYLNDFFHPGRERALEHGGAAKISDDLHRYAVQVAQSRTESVPQRFFSSLSAVSLAAKSQQPDSRILAVWAGFEGLLPPPPDQSVPRIVHFERMITPCVTADYVPRLFSEFRHDCLSINRAAVEKLIGENFGDHNALSSFIEIFYADGSIKSEFCSKIETSPLLLNRAYELEALANSAAKLQALRLSHIRRVRWQVNRIYRERNAIIHKASRTSVVQNLSEHAYSYFRSVILALESTFNRYGLADTDASLEFIRTQCNNLSQDIDKKVRNSSDFHSPEEQAKSVVKLTMDRRLREA
ncbi:hypothetical protein CLV80_103213 [Yoonia maritima]|uniref:Apea-like HEPN domain-containing protein n=1 Tax=Yoonia maritima TaxID=1435347 RepID=A0A2T0W1Q7_9RHOB|nr:hypothetical protein [Yoonia maritima]PRY78885.1 hypothetical protein CLV80_103213 [Yoonia maritima]